MGVMSEEQEKGQNGMSKWSFIQQGPRHEDLIDYGTKLGLSSFKWALRSVVISAMREAKDQGNSEEADIASTPLPTVSC